MKEGARLDAHALFEELGIAFSAGGKHGSAGWLQLQCPYCGDHSDHLGFNLAKEFFNCWKCGWHPLVATVADLAGIAKREAVEAIDRNRTGRPLTAQEKPQGPRPAEVAFPMDTGPLGAPHIHYLKGRGFSAKKIRELVETYGVVGTGPGGDMRLRIIAPVTYHGRTVSWQSRDITDTDKRKYIACDPEKEVRPHKHCLFGADLVPGRTVVVNEGWFDAVRLGPGAVATFGASFSWQQVRELVDRFDKRYIMYDPDNEGQKAAKKLTATLSSFPGETFLVEMEKGMDPGKLPQETADRFMESLGFKR